MVDVPTAVEFAALERRVAALEGNTTRPPETGGPITGIQAKRAADLIELFGVNTFSSLDEHNLWGSWPADYRPEQVIAALDWMTADSGYAFRIREYHYNGRSDMQSRWLHRIVSAIPRTRIALCIGANGTVDDANSMVALGKACGADWLEGLNEPNTDFGSGEVPFDATLAMQQAVHKATMGKVMGPSIVAGMPHAGGWIRGYCGDGLASLNALMSYGNGHYYPPTCPDLKGSGTSVSEYCDSLCDAYGNQPMMLTEFHPSLYNTRGQAPGQPGWDGKRDAYYTLLTLLRCGKITDVGLWWYALFDYGSTYVCGLFPTNSQDPRPAAHAIRTLCDVCADPGDRRGFKPGKLDVGISGLPADGDCDLYQISDGTFMIPLWRSAIEPGGASVAVTIELKAEATVSEFDILADREVQPPRRDIMLTSQLDAGVRMVIVRR